jgi:CBS-domain-containing membrane protein
MKISDILRSKGTHVVTVPPTAPVQQALHELVSHDIGAVVVYDTAIRGILTERDVLRAAALDVERLERALVQDLMTRNVISASPDARHRRRHAPHDGAPLPPPARCGPGRLCGIISIGDVVNSVRQDVEAENRQLHAYIHGVPL